MPSETIDSNYWISPSHGVIPSSKVEIASDTTTSTIIEDITGLSTTVTLTETSHIVAFMTGSVRAGSSNKKAYLAIRIGGTDSNRFERDIGSSDKLVHIVYRTASPVSPGTYTIKGRWYTGSSTTLTGTNFSLVAFGAEDDQGRSFPVSHVSTSDSTTATAYEDIDGLSSTVSTYHSDRYIFATLSGSVFADSNNTDIFISQTIDSDRNPALERRPSKDLRGIITASGRSSSLSSGSHTVKGEWYTDAGATAELDPVSMVGVGLDCDTDDTTIIPSGEAYQSTTTVTSTTLTDVTGASCTVTLKERSHIFAVANTTSATGSAGKSIWFAINIDGTDYDEHETVGSTDEASVQLSARTDTMLEPGTYTVKLRARTQSGVTVTLDDTTVVGIGLSVTNRTTPREIKSDAYIKQTSTETLNSDAYLTIKKQLPRGYQRANIYDDVRDWRFLYNYDQGRLEAWYTDDRENWYENTNARITCTAYGNPRPVTFADFCIDEGATELVIAYRDGDDIKVRRSSGYGSTNWSWGTAYTPLTGSGKSYYNGHVDHFTDGKILLTASRFDGTYMEMVATTSVNPNDPSSWTSEVLISSGTNTDPRQFSMSRATATSDAYYCVWNEGYTFYGRYYTGSVFHDIETVGDTVEPDYYRNAPAFDKDNENADKLYLLYDDPSYELVLRVNYDCTNNGNWGGPITVETDEAYYSTLSASASNLLYISYALSDFANPETRELYLNKSREPYTDWSYKSKYAGVFVTASNCNDDESFMITVQESDGSLMSYWFNELVTIQSDSNIKATSESTIDSDMFIGYIISETISSDAYILKPGEEGSIYSNSSIKQTYAPIIYQLQGYIKKPGKTETISSDYYITKSYSNTLDSDAWILVETSQTLSSDAQIFKEGEQFLTSNYYIKTLGTSQTISSDSYLQTPGTCTIDSDYYIKQSYTGTLDSNAEIKYLGYTQTISSDSYILDTYSATINCDGYIGKEYSQSITCDAYVKQTIYSIAQTQTYIKVVDNTENINTDAWILEEQTATLTSDYYIKKLGYESSIAQQAYIQQTYAPFLYQTLTYIKKTGNSVTINSDYYITDTYESTIDSDAHILKVTDQTIQSDYLIKKLGYEDSITTDYYIKKADNTETITSDAHLKQTYDQALNSDYWIFKAGERVLVSNYSIKVLGNTTTINSDSYIKKSDNTKTIDSNYRIKQSYTATLTSDYFILHPGYEHSIQQDAYIKKLGTISTINSDAYIKKAANTETLGSDAYILATSENTLDSDYYIKQASILTITSDSYIEKADNTETIDSDAWIRRRETATLTSDYIIKREGYEGSITTSAYIKQTYQPYIYLLGTYIQQTYDSTLDSDSYIKVINNTETITSDYWVLAEYEGSLSSDYYIKATSESTITSDAYIKATNSSTISSDAYIKTAYLGSLTQDAYIKTDYTATLDTVYYILKPGTAELISSGYLVEQTYEGSIFQDAYIKATYSTTIGSDYYIQTEYEGSIQSDYYIKATGSVTIDTDYYIKRLAYEGSVTSDYSIEQSYTSTITSDAQLEATSFAQLDSDYRIKAEVTQTIDSDYWVFKAGEYVLIANYYIKVLGTPATIQQDAFILTTTSNTIDSDAWILKETPQTIASDSYVKTSYDQSISSDSNLKVTGLTSTIDSDARTAIAGEWSDYCEFELRLPVSVTITSDYYILEPGFGSLVSDYHIEEIQEETLASNYFIKQVVEKFISSDYQVRGSTKPCIEGVEVVTPEICITERVDPVLEEVEKVDKPVIYHANNLSYRSCED